MELICSVSLIAKTIGILEDEDDDEHEDDSSNSEFGFSDLAGNGSEESAGNEKLLSASGACRLLR